MAPCIRAVNSECVHATIRICRREILRRADLTRRARPTLRVLCPRLCTWLRGDMKESCVKDGGSVSRGWSLIARRLIFVVSKSEESCRTRK